MKGVAILILFLFQNLYKVLEASRYELSVQFYNYSNPSGLDSEDNCCDGQKFRGICFRPCDPIFTVCLRGSNTPHNDDSCPQQDLMISSSTINNRNMLTFLDTIGNIDNPIVFNVENISNATQVYIHIHDVDSGQPAELVDEIFIEVPLSSESIGPLQQYSGVHGSVMMVISYRVTCSSDHYGSDCSVYCRPHNDLNNGHYTCNNITGDKECLPGYIDPTSNCIMVALMPISDKTSFTLTQSISAFQSTILHQTDTPGLSTVKLSKTKQLTSTKTQEQTLTSSLLLMVPSSTVESRGPNDAAIISVTVVIVAGILICATATIVLLIIIVCILMKKRHSHFSSGELCCLKAQDISIKGSKSLDNPTYEQDKTFDENLTFHKYKTIDNEAKTLTFHKYAEVNKGRSDVAEREDSGHYGMLYETPHDGIQPPANNIEVHTNSNNENGSGPAEDLYYTPMDVNSKQSKDKISNPVDSDSNKDLSLSIKSNTYEVPQLPVEILYEDPNF